MKSTGKLWTKIRLHQTGRFTKMSEQMQANFPTVDFVGILSQVKEEKEKFAVACLRRL